MKKNRRDHKGGIGIFVTAAGYAINATPDPELTTSPTSTPSSVAMNPRIANVTVPANTEVEQLLNDITIASLKIKVKTKFIKFISS